MASFVDDARAALRSVADAERAEHATRYFRTGPGEYGEGDQFLGVKAADMHQTAKRFRDLSLVQCAELLESPIHEDRMLALLVLVLRFERADERERREIYRLYLARTSRVSGWDLVDASAPSIVGAWLIGRDQRPLRKLARSRLLWDRRIAIVATLRFIRENELDQTLEIARILLDDREDLIHKAVGWMLREVGKRDRDKLESFLREHYEDLPRTTLRYAIERFSGPERKAWLKGPR